MPSIVGQRRSMKCLATPLAPARVKPGARRCPLLLHARHTTAATSPAPPPVWRKRPFSLRDIPPSIHTCDPWAERRASGAAASTSRCSGSGAASRRGDCVRTAALAAVSSAVPWHQALGYVSDTASHLASHMSMCPRAHMPSLVPFQHPPGVHSAPAVPLSLF